MNQKTLTRLMKALVILLIIGMNPFPVFAQDIDLKITSERKEDNTVDFYFEKNTPGCVTVSLDFPSLLNASFVKRPFVVDGRWGRLLTLRPINDERPIQFSYRYSYQLGAIDPRVKKDFVYLLPFKSGSKVDVQEMSNLGSSFFGSERPKNWRAYQFKTADSDTVYAARKGIVVKVEDRYQIDLSPAYTSKKNEIMIEHPDGTLAVYKGFGQKSVFVEPGDVVFPQTPLGTLLEGKNRGPLAFSVFFLCDENFADQTNTTLANRKSVYEYIAPDFLTPKGVIELEADNSYQVKVTENHITEEMTRREKRKRRKRQKK